MMLMIVVMNAVEAREREIKEKLRITNIIKRALKQ